VVLFKSKDLSNGVNVFVEKKGCKLFQMINLINNFNNIIKDSWDACSDLFYKFFTCYVFDIVFIIVN
jgi:hypothetical protein